MPADATFKFKMYGRDFGKAGQSIDGAILVGGKKVGSIEGTFVDRKLIRKKGGPGTMMTFLRVCDEVRSQFSQQRWVNYPHYPLLGLDRALAMRVRAAMQQRGQQGNTFSFRVEGDARSTCMDVTSRPGYADLPSSS